MLQEDGSPASAEASFPKGGEASQGGSQPSKGWDAKEPAKEERIEMPQRPRMIRRKIEEQ